MSKIALVDCDSFFVSCEQAENPVLRGKPVCVVTGTNGCVVSRSREAKKAGVKMGEPYFMAKKEFPEVCYINGRHSVYKIYSQKVVSCLQKFTPDVEVCSIDEAYLDMQGLDKLYHQDYVRLAGTIRRTIWQECRIPVSVGISSSKLLAKLASDKAKNGSGIYNIEPDNLSEILAATDLEAVCGFGRQHTAKMKMAGIFSCRDFVEQTDSWVRKNLGITGLKLKYELLGHAVDKIETETSLPKSIQNTSALTKFTADEAVLKASLKYHVHQAGRKLRQYDCFCRTVGIMLRTKDFHIYDIRVKLPQPTNSEREIFTAARNLLPKIYLPNILYRSSGVILENLQSYRDFQPSLFAEPEYTDDKISRVLDELEQKFGKDIVKNGLF
ncbi:MAG: hypothetical protein Q4D80_04790 [Pseudomonadota bacterium]|nr:hypothetical protein [Pseudomonadota bacterium]